MVIYNILKTLIYKKYEGFIDILLHEKKYRDLDCNAEVLSQDFRQPVQACRDLWPLDHSSITWPEPTFTCMLSLAV